VEGETDDAGINALRAQRARNFLATLLLSQGVPMLTAGDEIGRTQRGNNNAYCQDNEVSWVDWNLTEDRRRMLEFTRGLIRLRREHPVFRRRRFFEGRPLRGSGIKDIMWLKPDGTEMNDEEWQHDFARSLGVLLTGESLAETDARGRAVTDANFLILFNAHHEEIAFTLPNHVERVRWLVVLDTTHEDGLARNGVFEGGSAYALKGRSLALLQQQKVAR
jgi:glycogen operon protein